MRKVLFVSLGCDKNLADSEEMLGLLVAHGYTITNDETEADVAVVNTCAFIHDAKEESISNILEMARYKEEGVLKVLAVTGCLAQRYKDEIIKEIPEVDVVLGTTSFDALLEALDKAFGGEKYLEFKDISYMPEFESKRMITTGGHFEYLKIAEGCDKHCTYCIIPKLRGKYRSVPMEKLIRQAEYLAEQGVKELILVAQETTIYGMDLYGEKSLHKLLKELCRIPGICWIRILYCYPEEIYPELIQVMKEEKKICNYLDLPVQHASNRILKRMGRRTTKEELKQIVSDLRTAIPDIILRTTLITGFPGETPEDHEELMDFIDEMEFDRLGVFTYSPEEDTPAAAMPDQIPEEVKKDRQAELMELQQEISLDKGNERIGKNVLVMVEGKVADENAYVGRTYGDAPNVDGYIFINTDTELMSGDLCEVHITGALEYDLIGELKDEYTE
ncbi:MAG: 30S ribosomal protein S12 methylthiotransferase RimO [Blautia sp.]